MPRKLTRSKKFQTKLAAQIVAESHVSIWASRGQDGNFEIVLWNRGAEEIYGHTTQDALGQNYIELFVSDPEKKASAQDCDDIVEHGKRFINFVAEDIRKTGDRALMVTNCFRIKDPDSQTYYQVEIAIDITDTRLIEEHEKFRELREIGFRRAQQELEQETLDLHMSGQVHAKRFRDALSICEQALNLATARAGSDDTEVVALRSRFEQLSKVKGI